jgi:hypothetical protein
LRRELRISRAGAYRLARLLGRRLGRRIIVSRAVLETWLAGGGEGAGAQPSGSRPGAASKPASAP